MPRQGDVLAAEDAKEAGKFHVFRLSNQIVRLLTRRMWDAFKVLERSGLPTEELRQIWRLGAR